MTTSHDERAAGEGAGERPQPVGIFSPPAGLLLVPGEPPGQGAPSAADDGSDEVRASLLQGRLPAPWPPSLEPLRLAFAGDREGALAALDGMAADSPLWRYDRWVLDPDGDDPAEVAEALPRELTALVGVVQYQLGRAAAPPADLPEETAPEVRAIVLSARAAACLEDDDPAGAIDTLRAAAEAAGDSSPVLGAMLRGDRASVAADAGLDLTLEAGGGDTVHELLAAADALQGRDLDEARAELLLRAGGVRQEVASHAGDPGVLRQRLREAMQCYYDGLQLVSEEGSPQLWAMLNLNLAAAQMAVPMQRASDQLRLGVATQALRACRRVFTPEQHPAHWSTATLNLANALVYTPSTHQGDNLVEAVELYEEVIASGVRDDDPLGRARLLANQGNVLAHLGAFDPARTKLVDARYLFEEHGDDDAVRTVRGLLDEIARAEVGDPDEELADLARQSEQMARMPQGDGAYRAGMGVQVLADLEAQAPPTPVVTVVDPASRPTPSPVVDGADGDLAAVPGSAERGEGG